MISVLDAQAPVAGPGEPPAHAMMCPPPGVALSLASLESQVAALRDKVRAESDRAAWRVRSTRFVCSPETLKMQRELAIALESAAALEKEAAALRDETAELRARARFLEDLLSAGGASPTPSPCPRQLASGSLHLPGPKTKAKRLSFSLFSGKKEQKDPKELRDQQQQPPLPKHGVAALLAATQSPPAAIQLPARSSAPAGTQQRAPRAVSLQQSSSDTSLRAPGAAQSCKEEAEAAMDQLSMFLRVLSLRLESGPAILRTRTMMQPLLDLLHNLEEAMEDEDEDELWGDEQAAAAFAESQRLWPINTPEEQELAEEHQNAVRSLASCQRKASTMRRNLARAARAHRVLKSCRAAFVTADGHP